ncbi:CidA/LrgA family protein [Rossellomorea vietnamensis]|uniref:CidA/LrgA family protein n=1 Tax=Rossellomorea vietnamensis TaxID=218284 RepID=UPI001E51FF6E|nr:CidA/LrgA family protein [Rossellomorea vietnamensis]MCC5802490.1 CidA/LrgA family protein [Rossellomorea vietnamensis]
MQVIRVLIQMVILCLFYEAGKWCTAFFHLPIPGSIIGMLLLFLLLVTGVLNERLLLDGSGFFLRHFSFFFLPLSVSAIVLGPYFIDYGWKLLIILIVSGVIGFLGTSVSAEGFINWKEKRKYDRSY